MPVCLDYKLWLYHVLLEPVTNYIKNAKGQVVGFIDTTGNRQTLHITGASARTVGYFDGKATYQIDKSGAHKLGDCNIMQILIASIM